MTTSRIHQNHHVKCEVELAQLDHREVERDGKRQPHEDRREAQEQDDEHAPSWASGRGGSVEGDPIRRRAARPSLLRACVDRGRSRIRCSSARSASSSPLKSGEAGPSERNRAVRARPGTSTGSERRSEATSRTSRSAKRSSRTPCGGRVAGMIRFQFCASFSRRSSERANLSALAVGEQPPPLVQDDANGNALVARGDDLLGPVADLEAREADRGEERERHERGRAEHDGRPLRVQDDPREPEPDGHERDEEAAPASSVAWRAAGRGDRRVRAWRQPRARRPVRQPGATG